MARQASGIDSNLHGTLREATVRSDRARFWQDHVSRQIPSENAKSFPSFDYLETESCDAVLVDVESCPGDETSQK